MRNGLLNIRKTFWTRREERQQPQQRHHQTSQNCSAWTLTLSRSSVAGPVSSVSFFYFVFGELFFKFLPALFPPSLSALAIISQRMPLMF